MGRFEGHWPIRYYFTSYSSRILTIFVKESEPLELESENRLEVRKERCLSGLDFSWLFVLVCVALLALRRLLSVFLV